MSTPEPAVGVRAKVEFLRDPGSYPDGATSVEAVETHMAWVFLTDRHAWKLKKPVRYPFLDYSTLEARERVCREEVRLNRRLAGDVYLGVVPLEMGPDGRLALGDGGRARVADWLVKMRRLPRSRMLDHLLQEGGAEEERVVAAGELLARFYRDAPPVELGAARYRARLARDARENRDALLAPGCDVPGEAVRRAADLQLGFLARKAALLDRRVAAGRLVEGHGDLRPEHVCLTDPPVIIDCLEFDRELRLLDPADELSFLALECRRLGAPWVGRLFFETYARVTGDRPEPELVAFYTGSRALLRAKLALWHTRDEDVADPGHWTARAREYLELADAGAPGT